MKSSISTDSFQMWSKICAALIFLCLVGYFLTLQRVFEPHVKFFRLREKETGTDTHMLPTKVSLPQLTNFSGHCIRFSESDIVFDDLVWRTPTSLCLTPVIAATIDPSGSISNKTDVYSFRKWYWKKKHVVHTNPKFRTGEYISFIRIWQDKFQHVSFDTFPKVRIFCRYLQEKPNTGILVQSSVQKDIMKVACSLSNSRFHIIRNSFSADIIYAIYFSGNFKMGIVPQNSFSSLGPQNKIGKNIIYIPRTGNPARSVANSNEVLKVLRKSFGDKLIAYKPKNNWEVDRHIFANARVIIGPHGGAMGNIIFAPANTTIVEFLPLRRLKRKGENERPCYFGIAKGMGVDYIMCCYISLFLRSRPLKL